MKQNKSGFVLSEVLICVVIVGVVMALSVQTFKMLRSSYAPLTYYAYKNMRSVVHILFSSTMSEETTIRCKKSDGSVTRLLTPDGYTAGTNIPNCSDLPSGSGSSVVCNKIINDIMNTTKSGTTCTTLYSVNTSGSEPSIANLNPSSPTLRTTNGQRFYITKNVGKAEAGSDFEYGYRLIAVDLNGKRRPNTASSANQPPDIVTFLIMDNGDIYPLGVAADNYKVPDGKHFVNYIASAIKGYCYPKLASDGSGALTFAHCPLTANAYIPKECYIKRTKGLGTRACYYKIEKPANILSYRNAYCTVYGNATAGTATYKSYCNGAGVAGFREVCPPFSNTSTLRFDFCAIENIKPMFRFNFK